MTSTHAGSDEYQPEEPANGSYIVARWAPGVSMLWRRDDDMAWQYTGDDVDDAPDTENGRRWFWLGPTGHRSFPASWAAIRTTPPVDTARVAGVRLGPRPVLMLCVPLDAAAPASEVVDLDRADHDFLFPDGPGTRPEVTAVRALELTKRARVDVAMLRDTLDQVAQLAAAPAGYDATNAAYVVADDLAGVLSPVLSMRRNDPKMLARYARHLAAAAGRVGNELPGELAGRVGEAVECLHHASDELDALPPTGEANRRERA